MRNRRRLVQLVPQDPYSSLDPRMTVGRAIAEAIDPRRSSLGAHRQRVNDLLEKVALDASAADRLPHEFSGGQRQRIVIARALAAKPRVLVADEVTAALDSSVQAEVLNLLRSLQADLGIGMVFITHDLALARYLCTEIGVLYLGKMMEAGNMTVLDHPAHPYTRVLLDSVPDRKGTLLTNATPTLGADAVPDPAAPPPGCVFHPRCPVGPLVIPERTRCATEAPSFDDIADGQRRVACHFPLRTEAVSGHQAPEPTNGH
ncbi:peptide/nickel transport system ATP-binding protein [Actinokineospora alba]|uniref:Peptide/nickel transport system ATP-binding protein n=2 Tax=Actinokineospora alba TaxID=504798 RepID=A0A1H0L693_9PSEU|nr:peptide/nickel transport system ATP-binding protein [Actinokineospora alba]SDO63480.1 peptide/nickel transport system ATP-binding protein [Actinokineospora alba]